MSAATEQKAFWEENGYLVIEDLLTPPELERFRDAADALASHAVGISENTDRFKLNLSKDDPSGRLVQQVAEPHELGGEWMSLARDPRILDIVEGLLGRNIQLYYSMMMMKPPRQGFPVPWHQDLAFFVHDRAALLACQLYLDDATIENGCIHVVPGSHKLGLLNHYDGFDFTEAVVGDVSQYDEQQVALPVKAGGMAIWHCLTLHSSPPNKTEFPRRGMTFEFKDPSAKLMGGAFSPNEVRPAGLMVRGKDPSGALLSAV